MLQRTPQSVFPAFSNYTSTADLNLGIKTYLNGTLTSNIVIDTTEAATDTIDYVATDQTDLTATSTRTIIIEPAAAPSIVPTDDASTTTATSTSSQSGQGSEAADSAASSSDVSNSSQ